MAKDCSIIIPAYNAEKTIISALNSVSLEEPSKHDIEVIVVDDGSADATAKLVQEYAEVHKEVRLVIKDNGGVSSARNRGLDEAEGNYIYFMDADDLANRDALNHAISLMKNFETDLVIANYETYDKKSVLKNAIKHTLELNKKYDNNQIANDIIPGFIQEHEYLKSTCNKIYLRQFIMRYGIRFDEKRTHGEDWAFNIQYIRNCSSLIATDDILYTYIMDGSQDYNKYQKNLGYCLTNGYDLIEGLKKDYNILLSHEDEQKQQLGSAYRFIKYLRIPNNSKQEVNSFLKTNCIRNTFLKLSKLNKDELKNLDLSRKDKVAFYLLGHGEYKLALKKL